MKFKIFSRPFETKIHFGSFNLLLENRKAVFIIDSEVLTLYGGKYFSQDAISFPAGEKNKTREMKEYLEEVLFSRGFGKDCSLIAVGGGVVMDVVGFVASTFCRGVPLILIPTTLLGMVDACLGGKTAVNTPHGKNLIGSFYFPQEILIDVDFLHTLPEKERLNGMAEILKYGFIHSPSILENVHLDEPTIIRQCLAIKKEIIEADPFEERGYRRILNFGHTIGHALETVENYQISHGEAISIGMIVESYISQRLGYLNESAFEALVKIVQDFKFPLQLSRPYQEDEMLLALSRDKKSSQNRPRFVLLKSFGQVESFEGEYCTSIPASLLKETIQWMNHQFYEISHRAESASRIHSNPLF